MISEKSLERLSLILTICGIIALCVIVQNMEPETVDIGKITGDYIGAQVMVSGIIEEKPYWHSDGHLFLTLSDDDKAEIRIVMFESDARKKPGLKNLSKGMHVNVHGQVDEYRGELEIVAKDVEIMG